MEREAAAGKADRLAMLHAESRELEIMLSVREDVLSPKELAPFRGICEIEQEQLRFEICLLLRCGETEAAGKKARKLSSESSSYNKRLCRSEASPGDLLRARLKMLEAARTAEQLD